MIVNRAFSGLALATAALLLAAGSQAQAPGQPSAVIEVDCDRDCLIGIARQYVDALRQRDRTAAPISSEVRFTENNVEMPLGNEGLWGTVNAVWDDALEIADEETGNVAWFGIVEEHGNPAYLAARIRVEDGVITEVETVVNRLPDMPKPFGDPEAIVHDPAFNEVLPPEERRSRERLIAVADGYFNTVELNDGDVFTQFHPECGRLENGVLTTGGNSGMGGRGGRGGANNAATMAEGCEPQLRLGMYRINKRIRERRYPIVDVERGIVVASGFFDHANTFDRYTLTDGRVMNTVLKWPNSISLLEAFQIREGKIYRIEAVFTYVPYFMHSPFAGPNLDFQTR
jgi:hypothetical protein